jgi:hypothetical protein
MREIVNEIVRSAVVYGYLRGLDTAFAAGQAVAVPSPLWMRTNDLRTRRAHEEAERFLMRVHVEQAIQP